MYIVLTYFVDMQDDNHEYFPGDTFPRKNLDVSDSRLKELAGEKNARGIPLIANEKNIVKRR